ncbi:hypothetical protein IFM89_032842 [Coptis chinensis]|uniref:Peptidase S54 rhomboid domain-containing protein n=1 Tax=Coptis chinensis TaxID=261450 RepID=A0A835IDF5_9MAGN|nr:hypothetical protein IFM89_032842 [Coptis chinensis]
MATGNGLQETWDLETLKFGGIAGLYHGFNIIVYTGRIGLVYILSAFVGSLTAALFIKNNPAVTSSGALFGLLGAMLSVLI